MKTSAVRFWPKGVWTLTMLRLYSKNFISQGEMIGPKEERFKTVGESKGQVILVVWTLRDESRRIITMWKLDHGESERYYRRRNESG